MVAFRNLLSVFSLGLIAVAATNGSPASREASVASAQSDSTPASSTTAVETEDVAKRQLGIVGGIIGGAVGTVTGGSSFLQTSVRVCVTLQADIYVYSNGQVSTAPIAFGGSSYVRVRQGTCICVYASVAPLGTLVSYKVYISDNTNVGAGAQGLAAAILSSQCGVTGILCLVNGFGLGGNVNSAIAGGVCISYSTDLGALGSVSFSSSVQSGGDFSLIQPSFAYAQASLGPGYRYDGQCCAQTCISGYITCNNQCVSAAQYTCPSGMPIRKPGTRRDLKRRSAMCPAGTTACAVPGSRHMDCVDIQNDVETCGGCVNPLRPNAPGSGVDCTAIAGARDVSCVRGACQVHACARGFALSPNGTACEKLASPYGSKKNREVLKMARRQAKLL